jgi:hypothetical protein
LHGQGRAHSAFAAGRAFGDVDAGNPEQGFLPRLGFLLCLVMIGTGEKLPALIEFLPAAPVSQQTVMPDLHESIRQHVKQEQPDYLYINMPNS